MRKEVFAFAELMEAKPAKHDEERGSSWKGDAPNALLKRLQQEVEELVVCAELWDKTAGIDEAVDVANLAMFIADVLGGLEKKVQG